MCRSVPRALRLRAGCGIRERRRSDALWSYGFIARESGPLNVMLPHGINPSRAALFHDASRWSFSWADTDVETTWREHDAPVHEEIAPRERSA